jgi:hypothetical protein
MAAHNHRHPRRPTPGEPSVSWPATATADPVTIAEATTARMTPTGRPRRYRARLIEGNRWGTSGYYPRAVIERDGPTAWPAGTLSYLDHPTPDEEAARPERSVRDLAAKIVTTPVYESDGLYADIEVFPHAAPLVDALAETIGLSVRGEGTARFGEVAGRQGMIIESLDRGHSVDFVTKAGAGGKLVSLLESARAQGVQVAEARNIGAWLESRLHLELTELADNMYGAGTLTRAERITLSSAIGDALQAYTARVEADAPQLFQRDLYDEPAEAAGDVGVSEARRLREASTEDTERVLTDLVRDAYGGDDPNTYVWVRDFDPDRHIAWFDVNTPDGCDTYQQAYAVGDGGQLSLSGERVEVVARTDYTPVAQPGDEDIAEAARPPDPTPVIPAAPTVPLTVTEGVAPTAPNPPPGKELPMSGSNTGPAPGAGGAADNTGQAAPVDNAAVQAATARAELAEAQRDEAIARSATLAEAAQAQARILAERDAAIAESRRLRADTTARTAVATAVAEAGNIPEALRPLIGPRVTDRIVGRVPLAESGDVNVEAMNAAIGAAIDAEATYAAALLEAQGVGTVQGLGSAAQIAELSEADFEKGMVDIFTEIGLPSDLAKNAAKGR